MPNKGSIVIVGTGLQLGHMTFEARSHIKIADIVYYVVTDSVTEEWLRRNSKSLISMRDFYKDGIIRRLIYERMTDTVLQAAKSGKRVCAAFYGHPGVFVTPSHNIIRIAKEQGIPARMLPGISAEDCLFADIGFDPGTTGCQAFEATDFLLCERKPETGAWLIIWQPDSVGDLTHNLSDSKNANLLVLKSYIQKYYPSNHKAIIYEANTFIEGKPKIEWIDLENLENANMSGISTLIVPPITGKDVVSKKMVNRLNLSDLLNRKVS